MNRDAAILAFVQAGNKGEVAVKMADALIESLSPSRLHDLQISLQDANIELANTRKLAEARRDALIKLLGSINTSKLDYQLLNNIRTNLI
jgi:hypothetical protein